MLLVVYRISKSLFEKKTAFCDEDCASDFLFDGLVCSLLVEALLVSLFL